LFAVRTVPGYGPGGGARAGSVRGRGLGGHPGERRRRAGDRLCAGHPCV